MNFLILRQKKKTHHRLVRHLVAVSELPQPEGAQKPGGKLPRDCHGFRLAWDGLGVLVGAEARGKTRLFGDLYGFDSRPLSIFKWGFCIYDLYSKPFSRQTSAIIFRSRGPNLCSTVVQSTCERVCQNSLGSGGM